MTAAHTKRTIRLGHRPLGQGVVAHAPRGLMVDRASCLMAVAIGSTPAAVKLASEQLPGYLTPGYRWTGRDQSQAGDTG